MCGICGIYNFNKDAKVSKDILTAMNDSINHRGPDEDGYYVDGFIGLGHKRLSIIDLSSGQQPISNEDGTIWISYNGEIYNYLELKSDLVKRGHRFKTNCDTEVVVHAYEEYGRDCVHKFNGMFAFAIWDSNKEQIFLARDRLGIKPLYYFMSNKFFLFASEIKAILKHPEVPREVELNSIPEYLFCTSILNGNTMFKNISTLQAGHYLTVKNNRVAVKEYWDICLNNSMANDFSLESSKNKISELMKESVKMRLMSEVPFGSLLSGGLDSSLISALATGYVKSQLSTFSIEFTTNNKFNAEKSDTKYANLMAKAFKTNHRDFILEPDAYENIKQIVTYHLEKPVELTTPSLYLLYKNLKKYITVVLSGEGADEMFGGYFFFLNNLNPESFNEFPWAPYFNEVSMLLNEDVHRTTNFSQNIKTTIDEMLNKYETDDFLNKVLYLFLKIYLLEMLERQDKTSMAWAVETRVPFLDHRLVEYVANIPSQYKLRGDNEKFILKESFINVLPSEIIERKKKPFPFPVDPKTLFKQRNKAIELVQSGQSKVSAYFNKNNTEDFFKKKNKFQNIDNLAIFRTSHAILALEDWHTAFDL